MSKKKFDVKKIALISVMITLSLILSYVESRIPVLVAIPGVKLGLANLVIIIFLYVYDYKEAIIISFIRLFLSTILFSGFVTMLYGLAGAILSLTLMIILKKSKIFSVVFVSIVGGVSHNIGQIIVACLLVESSIFLYYLPYLLISGTVAGLIIGILAAVLTKRIQPFVRRSKGIDNLDEIEENMK